MDRYKIMKIISRILLVVILVVLVFLGLINFGIISFKSSEIPLALNLNQTEVGIKVGNTYQLNYTVSPSSVNYGGITWVSSDPSIVKVNENTGYIEGLKVGEAIVTASTPYNKLSAECKIKVEARDILITRLTITNDQISLATGSSYQLKWTVSPSNATTHNFNFSSSDTKVAVVNEKGVIKAVGPGSAVITMKSKLNGIKDTATVTVYRYSNSNSSSSNGKNNTTSPDNDTYYRTKSVKLSKTSLELSVSSSYKLSATITPSNANQKVNWTSGNESILTINSDGVITTLREGTTNVIATSIDGVSSVCKVSVVKSGGKDTPKEGIEIEDQVLRLEVGTVKTLKINYYLANGANKSVLFSSSNSEIAYVENGSIVARSVGTCVIKATSSDGKYSDYVTVTVIPATNVIALTGIKFAKTSYEAAVNETITLIPTIEPTNATNRFLKWTTSNRYIATVSNGVVYCVGTGTVTITASEGNISSSVTIKVKNVTPTSISIENGKSDINLTVGENLYLVKKIIPSNSTNTSVTWTSSNPSIATIDQNGLLKAVSKGTVQITVKTFNGKEASVNVNVN